MSDYKEAKKFIDEIESSSESNINVDASIKKLKSAGILSYDIRPMVKSYPKAINKFKEYINKTSQFPIEDSSLPLITMINPRMLYDFFDSEGVYCGVVPDEGCTFSGFTDEFLVKNSMSRHEAEIEVFNEAFKILNGKS